MASYAHSKWIWSEAQQRHYCAAYDIHGNIVEYHWEGGYVQRVPPVPPQQSQSQAPAQQSTGNDQSSSPSQSEQTHDTGNRIPRSYFGQQQTVDLRQNHPAPTAEASSSNYVASPQAYPHGSSQSQFPLSSSVSQNQNPFPSTFYHSGLPPQSFGNAPQPTHNASPYQSHTAQSYDTTPAQPPTYSPTLQFPLPAFAQPLPQSIQETVGGDKRNRVITTLDSSTDYETLHSGFRKVSPKDHERFFVRGRVFKMLWTEPAGCVELGKSRGSTHFSLVKFSETAYSEIRRFVVINNKGAFSQCIPIQSYRGQGATKQGLVVADHAIIYTGTHGTHPPRRMRGEEELIKQPIRVHPRHGEGLTSSSRINFGKPYAVEHNCKLYEIGIVADSHLHLLSAYFAQAMGVT